MQQLETTKTMVTEAVLDTVHRKIFEKVTSRDDIPAEYGTREEMMAASTKLQLAFKEQMRKTYLIKEGIIIDLPFFENNKLCKWEKRI